MSEVECKPWDLKIGLLSFFPREVTGMLAHMARAFIGTLFVAMWLVFLLYTQGGPISVVTGASRDIFIPLVQTDGVGVASPNPPQSSAELDSAQATRASVRSNKPIYGSQAAPEASEDLASSPPQTAAPAPAAPAPAAPAPAAPAPAVPAPAALAPAKPSRGSKSRLAYARFPKTGSRYAISHLFKVMGAHRLNVIPEAKAVRAVGVAKDEFLLASVRNPCESYLSLWAFQSEAKRRAGVMADLRRRDPEAHKRLVGRDSQNGFTGPEDVQRFRAWIKFMGHQHVKLGLLSGRFYGKYLSQDPDMDIRDNAFLVRVMTEETAAQTVQAIRSASISELADCWMHTESLDADIAGCSELRDLGGFPVERFPSGCSVRPQRLRKLGWPGPARTSSPEATKRNFLSPAPAQIRVQVEWSKVQSVIQSGTSSGGHGGSKHGGCETFFDEATAARPTHADWRCGDPCRMPVVFLQSFYSCCNRLCIRRGWSSSSTEPFSRSSVTTPAAGIRSHHHRCPNSPRSRHPRL